MKNFYFTTRFLTICWLIVLSAVLGFMWPVMYGLSLVGLMLVALFLLLDVYILYGSRGGITGRRSCPEMLSNGEDNEIKIFLESQYGLVLSIEIREEAPVQFQLRKLRFNLSLPPNETKTITYNLHPTERGNYLFGNVNIFTQTFIGLAHRRFLLAGGQEIKVYPSIEQMKKTDVQIFSKIDLIQGIKKVRRAGQHTEFEEIKEYTVGDDYRRINWKATARKRQLMLNVFQEEKSRPIYCVINKGRTMQMPFEGLSLFDYAVNASLAISNIILKRSDKAGLISFERTVDTLLPASSRKTQLRVILDLLYAEQTKFAEPNYYDLFLTIKHQVSQRSVLLLFTNFESHSSLEQQLPVFKKLNRAHVLVVIFFENTELRQIMDTSAKSVADVYEVAIAEKFDMEKRTIRRALARNGIQTILTRPESLTIDTINKYLEIKSKGLI